MVKALLRIKDKYYRWEVDKKVLIFIICFEVAGILAAWLDYFDHEHSYHDVLVEFHGLVFDLFLFGIVITWYEAARSRKEERYRIEIERKLTIKRYLEELEDYQHWRSDESSYRTQGIIRRLVNENATDITLKYSYLHKARFEFLNLSGYVFVEVELKDGMFYKGEFDQVIFSMAKLRRTKFLDVTFKQTLFMNLDLSSTLFHGCDLRGVSFFNVEVPKIDWFSDLRVNFNDGVEELMKRYIIEEVAIEGQNRKAFKIFEYDTEPR